MVNVTEGASAGGRVLPRFIDKLMGVRVMLINSVMEVSQDGETAPIVPDIEGLEAAIAVARSMVPDKLSGKEIRFLRKTLGQKGAELARFLDVRAETLSRWENGKEVITTNAERVLRFRVVADLKQKAPGVEVDVAAVMSIKPSPFRMSTLPTTLVFEHVSAFVKGTRQKVWLYQGISDEKEESDALPIVKLA
jgi:hypothetical protein